MALFKKLTFGLDISDRSLKAVLLSGSRKPRLLGLGYLEIPAGIVEAGIIHDAPALSASLKRMLSKRVIFGRFKSRRVVVSFPEAQTYLHYFSVPRNIEEGRIAEFLEKMASRVIPLEEKERVSDFRVIAEGARLREVAYVAAKRKIVEQWHKTLHAAGLEAVVLEPELEALARSASISYNKRGTYIVADLGVRSVDMGVVEDGHVRFSLTLKEGGNDYTSAIADSLHIGYEEAERIKRSYGLRADYKEGRVMQILQKELQSVLEELRRTADFYSKKGSSIDVIILAGGSSLMPGLVEYISDNVNIPARVLDPWMPIDISALLEESRLENLLAIEPILYATSLGLGQRAAGRNPENEGLNLFRNINPYKGRLHSFLRRFSRKTL